VDLIWGLWNWDGKPCSWRVDWRFWNPVVLLTLLTSLTFSLIEWRARIGRVQPRLDLEQKVSASISMLEPAMAKLWFMAHGFPWKCNSFVVINAENSNYPKPIMTQVSAKGSSFLVQKV